VGGLGCWVGIVAVVVVIVAVVALVVRVRGYGLGFVVGAYTYL